MLADSVRNSAFAEALKTVIIPGETVVADIGSGTGYLSFLAAKYGAKKCYLYESNADALELSKQLAAENSITNVEFVLGNSKKVTDPPKVDVVVAEVLGHFALEENIIETLRDAKRFLKPNGVMIPQSVTQYVAPVITASLYESINTWGAIDEEIDFSSLQEKTNNKMFLETIHSNDVLEEQEWDSIDFQEENSSQRTGTAQWQMQEQTTVYGFGLWWNALLTQGVELSTSPASEATHWQQTYIPISTPLVLEKGHTLEIKIESDSHFAKGVHVMWNVIVRDGDKVVATQSYNTKDGIG